MRFLLLVVFAFGIWSSPSSAAPSDDGVLFLLGSNLYRQGLEESEEGPKRRAFEAAARKFDQYHELHPQGSHRVDSLFFLGLALDQLGRRDESSKALKRVVSERSGSERRLQAYEVLGNYAAERKDWKSATTNYQSALALVTEKKQRERLLSLRAQSAQKSQDPKLIDQALRDLVESPDHPSHHQAAAALAEKNHRGGNLLEALSLFETAAKSKSSNLKAKALLRSGLLAHELGRPDKATSYLESYLDLDEHPEARSQAQLLLLKLYLDAENAPQAVRLAKEIEPANDRQKKQFHTLAAKAHQKLGQPQLAEGHLRELASLSPNSALAFDLAYQQIKPIVAGITDQNFAEVEKFLKDHRASHSDNPRILAASFALARFHAEKQRPRRALEILTKFKITDSPHHQLFKATFLKALCHHRLGEYENALREFEASLPLSPSKAQSAQVHFWVADCLSELKRDGDALNSLRAVLAHQPKPGLRIATLKKAAAIYKNQQNYHRFGLNLAALLKVPNLTPQDEAFANFWLGWNAHRTNQPQKAVAHLRRARHLGKDQFKEPATRLILDSLSKGERTPDFFDEIAIAQELGIDLPGSMIMKGIQTALTPGSDPPLALILEILSANRSGLSAVDFEQVATFALQSDQPGLALKIVEVADLASPPSSLRLTMARAYFLLKNYKEAGDLVDQLLQTKIQGGATFEVRMLAGDLAFAQSQFSEAARQFVTAAEIYSDTREEESQALIKAIAALEAHNTKESIEQIKDLTLRLKSL